MARKTRDEVSICEVVALLDARLARVRSFRRHVYANKVELKSRGVYIRKLNELRLERLIVEQIRNKVRGMRYVARPNFALTLAESGLRPLSG